MPQLIDFLFIGIGSILGSFLRYALSLLTTAIWQTNLPATLVVNAVGSFCFTFLITLFGSYFENNSHVRLFFLVGFLGSFTTFSTFSFHIIEYFQKGAILEGILYMTVSVIACITLAYIGWHWGSLLNEC